MFTKIPIAYKFLIGDLLRVDFNNEKKVILLNGEEIKKVHVFGNVIRKFISDDGNYGFLVIEDGTGEIRVRVFRENVKKIEGIKRGDIVDVIGRVEEWKEERYINPDIISPLPDINWEIYRKLLFIKMRKFEEKKEIFIKDTKEEILDYLKKVKEDSLDNLKKKFGDDVKEILAELMDSGDIYEPRPNVFRILE